MALFVSSAVHAVLFLVLVLPPPERGPDLSSATASVFIDVAVPGIGPPGAPRGDAPNMEPIDDLAERLDAPAVPPPRAPRASVAPAPGPAPSIESSPLRAPSAGAPTEIPEVPEAPSAAGNAEGDAFIDALIARSRGGGTGARGNGGGGCPDPIDGTWYATKYRESEGRWVSFMLHVERVADGEALTGHVVQHSWTGGPGDRSPPRCTPGMTEYRVRMGGQGVLRGDQVRFDALGPASRTVLCMGDDLGYNLDHFAGTVRGNRMLAVNNDGGRDVDQAYTFRRTSCD
ncbi:MAG: hypothetical protein DRJ42_03240 [Deltaproteobacteria bacterium]|nr:MAG: hypothetical protein DRJ42_03240 [Deltaproteobacteria bacterium]